MPLFLRTENDDDDTDSHDLLKKRNAELDKQSGECSLGKKAYIRHTLLAAARMSKHLPLDYVPQTPLPAVDICDSGAGTMERGSKKPLCRQRTGSSETETHMMEQGCVGGGTWQ